MVFLKIIRKRYDSRKLATFFFLDQVGSQNFYDAGKI
jgi:hypothetical protein